MPISEFEPRALFDRADRACETAFSVRGKMQDTVNHGLVLVRETQARKKAAGPPQPPSRSRVGK